MRRDDGSDGGFGAVSAHERRQADAFFSELVGRPVPGYGPPVRAPGAYAPRPPAPRPYAPRPYESDDAEDAPTIALSTPEVLVCVGGVNNATVTATTTGGGTVSWRIGDPTRASVTASGNTATIKGLHPGVTTVEAALTSGGTTVKASARLLVCFVQLLLRNTGTIEPAPENEDEAAERAAAGGTNALGPLPMGTGRADFVNTAYTSPLMVVGRVFPDEAATRFSFKWQRLIDRRSWRFRRNAAGTRWNVTFRSQRGPLDDDTGAADFNDASPATPGGRIYIYDNSALALGPETIGAGEFVHEKKDFIYRVWIRLNGVWSICSAIHVGQAITARRIATSGAVATDWAGVENSTAIRQLTTTITDAQVRAIVGGTDPIDIAAGANP